MSKDKGSKNTKKAPATESKKTASDYQAKKAVSKDDIAINKKKL
jgi:hypothetical protein